MKLYTEEQVRQAIKMARSSYNLVTTPFIYDQHEVLEQLTPIELPSDEEIESKLNIPRVFEYEGGSIYDRAFTEFFINGAKWMRSKTYGGDK